MTFTPSRLLEMPLDWRDPALWNQTVFFGRRQGLHLDMVPCEFLPFARQWKKLRVSTRGCSQNKGKWGRELGKAANQNKVKWTGFMGRGSWGGIDPSGLPETRQEGLSFACNLRLFHPTFLPVLSSPARRTGGKKSYLNVDYLMFDPRMLFPRITKYAEKEVSEKFPTLENWKGVLGPGLTARGDIDPSAFSINTHCFTHFLGDNIDPCFSELQDWGLAR